MFRTSEKVVGLLKVKVVRGVNLAVRDLRSSDPYVVVSLGSKKLKTHVVKKNVNPEWNEDLTFSIVNPHHRLQVEVFDKDRFTRDDSMGTAELDIQSFVKAACSSTDEENFIRADSEAPYWYNGRFCQDVVLRLNNVECGEVELQLQWVTVPKGRGN